MEINTINIRNYVDDPDVFKQKLLVKYFKLSGNDGDYLELERFPKIVEAVFVALCTNGSCNLLINQKSHPFKAGNMCICFSATILQTINKTPDFECIVLATNVEFIQQIDIPSIPELFLAIREKPCISLLQEEQQILLTYFKYINQAYERKNNIYRIEITQQLLLTLCYEIASIYQYNQQNIRHILSHKDTLFRKFIQLLSNKYLTERRVSFYAEALCVTPKYLSSMVKEVSHKSAAEWINDFVLRSAKILLTTPLTIQQISDELNFPNPSFFTQHFKRFTGKTPKEYRLNTNVNQESKKKESPRQTFPNR